MSSFDLQLPFKLDGSQPEAVKKIQQGFESNKRVQTLLGVTGSGKTVTMAATIAKRNKPTLIMAHNKTLAAQLYNELKELFPNNRVEYFVSYYDYYQPESYIPSKDLYIEKDAQVNPRIEQMRLSATASLLSRSDTIVVSSVSCIYNVGNPKDYKNMGFEVEKNQSISRKHLLEQFVNAQYQRNDMELMPGRFRVKGDTIDFIPGYHTNIFRIELFGDAIDRITERDKTTDELIATYDYLLIYPAKHFAIPQEAIKKGIQQIRTELDDVAPNMGLVEQQRLIQRTNYDIEMIQETGFCKGIENYSVYFDGRTRGQRPFCLIDYFPKDSLMIIDESHQSIPQVHGMFNGDRARKKPLIEYGFRLPSALDNRPLTFEEFEKNFLDKKEVLFVSATPALYEKQKSSQIVEQLIRPTGLVDPQVFVRPIKGQIDDLAGELNKVIAKKSRALITTLTKRLAEELTEYLAQQGIATRYLHSEIDTLERSELIRQLRLGEFDVLVGINLLREGLDIPEVGFIAILDADKEGFLRDSKSLIQTIGRAARNNEAYVVLYADIMTDSMKRALSETKRRREVQLAYNKKHNITPKTIVKPVREQEVELKDTKNIPKASIPQAIKKLEKEMQQASENLEFERAIVLRNKINSLLQRQE
ncbi:MAG: excinuclease ABC subunit UvrB [Candidatus Woesearchaeota archaeon]